MKKDIMRIGNLKKIILITYISVIGLIVTVNVFIAMQLSILKNFSMRINRILFFP